MTSPLCILVAHFEDEPRQTVARFLEEEGVRVLQAATGPEAVQLANDHRPFLALISALLPGMNGFEVCQKLARIGDDGIPVVLTSDTDDPFLRARARHVAARGLMLEPLTKERATEILETSWASVDPLDVSHSGPPGAGSRQKDFLRDLMGKEGRRTTPPTHFSKVSDPLTGLVFEAYLTMRIQEECKRASRYQQPVSLLIVEIENLDDITHEYGRRAGDEALLEVAGVFLCESRDVDVAGRAGPATFHLLMPNTPYEGARVACRRIQEDLRGRRLLWEGNEIPIQVRVGLGTLDRDANPRSDQELIQAATERLSTMLDIAAPALDRQEGAGSP